MLNKELEGYFPLPEQCWILPSLVLENYFAL
jgi:hypothetical protein